MYYVTNTYFFTAATFKVKVNKIMVKILYKY